MIDGRAALLADEDRRGRSFCTAYTGHADDWFASLFAAATEDAGTPSGVALVAVGGYGRAELCPFSDLDVLLLHDKRTPIAGIADRLWYPVWDAGLKLGHAVRTVRDALSLAADDLDTATSLLDCRHLAGDERLTQELAARAAEQWQKRAKRWLAALAEAVAARHRAYGEVAFLLEPDLKEGRGGLRDVHALGWAEAARQVLLGDDPATLTSSYEVLLDARVELHRRTGRAGDQLLLQEQDAVAAALGDADADVLMHRVAAAARTIAWTSDETWDRIGSSLRGPIGRLAARDRAVGRGVVLRDGQVVLTVDADPAADPALVLRAAAVAAHEGVRIERGSLDRLAAEAPEMPDPWPDDARHELVSLLGAGRNAIAVLETLDRRDLLTRILPEWAPVRSRPQRNAYHRFTVDRHLCEAAVEAAALAREVARPDLLLLGAWLHDIGKGYPGDHTQVGMERVGRIGLRMGFPPDDVAVLVTLVRDHLLLPDVATRRDLDDDATIAGVASAVGSLEVLELLDALTEADSLATGPAAWGSWKAGLVRQLVGRVAHVLRGGHASEVTRDSVITPEIAERLAAGAISITAAGRDVTIVCPDRRGLFASVAGTLALHGLDVLAADVWSSDDGMAVEVIRVEPTLDTEPRWDRVEPDLVRSLEGRLSLDARLAERAATYRRRTPKAAEPAQPRVIVDNEASAIATVLEVRAPDGEGVLYRVTRALSDLDLDIHHAKVQTLGHEVVDTFYVRDPRGDKITDAEHLAEIEAGILHVLAQG